MNIFNIIDCKRIIIYTKIMVSEIFFSNSDLSVSYLVFKTNSLETMPSTLVLNLSYTSFLTTSFLTTSFSLLKSTGTGANL